MDWWNFMLSSWLEIVRTLLPAFVLYLFLKSYFPSYFSEKGKNLATKEDIGLITTKIEEVRLGYSKELEAYKAQHQIRIATLDRQFVAHQEAYTHWSEVMNSMHQPEKLGDKRIQALDWWYANCLYLNDEARAAFKRALSAAGDHALILATTPRDPPLIELVKANWKKIEDAGDAIVRGVQLSGLIQEEKWSSSPDATSKNLPYQS